jgi:hypothetical protein
MALERTLQQALREVEAAMRARNIVAIHITTEDDVYDPRGTVELTAYDSIEQVEGGEDAPREFDKFASLVECFENIDSERGHGG